MLTVPTAVTNPSLMRTGQDTTYFTCLYSGEEIILSWVNDVYIDCHDQTDEPEGYMTETSSFTCDSGDTVPFARERPTRSECPRRVRRTL